MSITPRHVQKPPCVIKPAFADRQRKTRVSDIAAQNMDRSRQGTQGKILKFAIIITINFLDTSLYNLSYCAHTHLQRSRQKLLVTANAVTLPDSYNFLISMNGEI